MWLRWLIGYWVGFTVFLVGWSLFYSGRTSKLEGDFPNFPEGDTDSFLGMTIFCSLVWPLASVVLIAVNIGRQVFYRWPRAIWWKWIDRRDRIILAKLRENPSLLDSWGERLRQDGTEETFRIRFRGAGEHMYLARVRDRSTGQIYVLRIPPNRARSSRSVQDAIAWTFHRDAHEYHPQVIT